MFFENRHLKIHEDSIHRGVRYKCEDCGKGFISQESKKKHFEKYHGRTKSLKCESCNAEFYDEKDLSKHVEVKHLGLGPKCELCQKVFQNEVQNQCLLTINNHLN